MFLVVGFYLFFDWWTSFNFYFLFPLVKEELIGMILVSKSKHKSKSQKIKRVKILSAYLSKTTPFINLIAVQPILKTPFDFREKWFRLKFSSKFLSFSSNSILINLVLRILKHSINTSKSSPSYILSRSLQILMFISSVIYSVGLFFPLEF